MTLTYTEANTLRYKVAGVELPDDVGRGQFLELLTAGVNDILQHELVTFDARRHAAKDAALEVAAAANWSAVAAYVRDRDQALKSGARIERVSA